MKFAWEVVLMTIIIFVACKQPETGTSRDIRLLLYDTIPSKVNDVDNEKIQIIQCVIVPKQINLKVDSIVFYGKVLYETKLVDSFIVHFTNREKQKIFIPKDKHGYSEYDFILPNQDEKIFNNLNSDENVDLVFNAAHGSASQIRNSIIYLFNPKKRIYIFSEELSKVPGLVFNKINNEYISKQNNGLGRYEFKKFRFKGANSMKSKELYNFEKIYVNHLFNEKKYDKTFTVKYENFDSLKKYSDTCSMNLDNCKISLLICDKKIFKILKQTWNDYYASLFDYVDCPEINF